LPHMLGKSRPLSARLKMDSLDSSTRARPVDSASRVSNRRLMFSLDKAAAIIDNSTGRNQRLDTPPDDYAPIFWAGPACDNPNSGG